MERNHKQIDQLERDQLAIHRSTGLSFSAIGKLLGRSGSALSREYKRNLNHAGNYLPSEAGDNAKRRKKWAAETGSKCEAIDKKEAFGHWEGDSIVCSQSTVSLNVMIERQTQYVSIRRVENRGVRSQIKRWKTP